MSRSVPSPFWAALLLSFCVTAALAQGGASITIHPQFLPDAVKAGGITGISIVVGPRPEYSNAARLKLIDGLCVLTLTIDTEGKPQDISPVWCVEESLVPPSVKALSSFKFRPAAFQGKPIAVKATAEIEFSIDNGTDPGVPARVSIDPPPGQLTEAPDDKGIYSLTGAVSAPQMLEFIDHNDHVDQSYGRLALLDEENGVCDAVVVISAKGKLVSLDSIHCTESHVEAAAKSAILKSRFKQGSLNGKSVPIRVTIHLTSAANG